MNIPEFIVWIQSYYGPYPEGQREDIVKYLAGERLSNTYLEALKNVLVKRVGKSGMQMGQKWIARQHGEPPDIAVFEQWKPEALDICENIIQENEKKKLQLEDQRTREEITRDPTSTQMREMDWAKAWAKIVKKLEMDKAMAQGKDLASLKEKLVEQPWPGPIAREPSSDLDIPPDIY